MKVEVACSGCRAAYLLDAEFSGTSLPCPSCGAQDGLRVPTAPPAAAGSLAAEAAAQESEEVVCPRCKLHFVPRRATAEAAQGGRRRVLVVEDMEYFREIATDALSSTFEICEATTLEEARARLAEGSVDLMLLDLTFGGGNAGVEFLRSLEVKPCPVVIFADQDESEMYGESWEKLKRLGADDIVMKGMNAGESLARKVGSLLGITLDEDA